MKPSEQADRWSRRATAPWAELLAQIFADAGWRVDRNPDPNMDMVVRRGRIAYGVEVKVAAEGRPDRLIPLWSQAWLQASRWAGESRRALAVVAAPIIAPRVADQVLKFATDVAPNAAAGVIDSGGLRRFKGAHLEVLSSVIEERPRELRPVRRESAELFSDLNQWMLKLLLAPELPERLLGAPRDRYRNASQLAAAAGASVMTSFRFIERLKQEGFLHESDRSLTLVRRRELFQRWKESTARRVDEVPMRFIVRGKAGQELRRLLVEAEGCLALFAAADALRLGYVHGVPPYLYIARLDPSSLRKLTQVRPADAGEVPDVILRRAFAPRSIFGGQVTVNGMAVCDVLQVWLDVSAHPARGQEQADVIRERVLDQVMDGTSSLDG